MILVNQMIGLSTDGWVFLCSTVRENDSEVVCDVGDRAYIWILDTVQ
jgi:hypothetical protein